MTQGRSRTQFGGALAACVAGAITASPQGVYAQGLIGDVNGEQASGGITESVATVDTWQNYSYTFKATNPNAFVTILLQNVSSSTSLDDISLVQQGDPTELLQNGGLEIASPTPGVNGITLPASWTAAGTQGLPFPGSLVTLTSPDATPDNNASHSGSGVWVDTSLGGFDGLAQNVTLKVGQNYTLSFWMGSPVPFDGNGVETAIYLANNIDAEQPSYLASNLGTAVNPAFQGGTLLMDQASGLYTQDFTLDGSATSTIDQNGNQSTFSGTFSDATPGTPGNITISNSGSGGAVTLTGINTYTGTTTINIGATLALAGNGSIATSAGVIDNGEFDISNATSGAEISALTGQGVVTLGSQTLTLTNASGTFSGTITGAGGLIITGGTAGLSGNNGYTGATTIGIGATLALSGSGSVANSSGVIDSGMFDISATSSGAAINTLTGNGTVTLGSQTLTLTNAGDTFTGAIEGTGGGLMIAGGTETLSGTNTFSGATTIGPGAKLALYANGSIANSSGVANSGTFDISNTTSGAAITALTGNGSVALGSQTLAVTTASGTFAGVIGGAGGGLTISGGTQTLSGNNTFTGATTIGATGTLALGGNGSIATSVGVTDDGAFDIANTSSGAAITALAGSGNITLGARTLTLTNASGTFSGAISGTGAVTIGGGVQVLSGTNSYTGASSIGGGATLALAGSGSIANSSGVADNGSLDISNTNSGAAITTLSGNGSVLLGSKTLTLTKASGTFSGTISGSGALVATGGGTLILSPASGNTYSGGTTITGGTILEVASDAALGAASGGITFDNGTLIALGSFTSNRSITANSGGGLINANGFSLDLTGIITQIGTLVLVGNGGTITTSTNITVTSGGSISNSTTIATPALNVDGAYSNTGVVNVGGSTTIGSGGSISNSGTLITSNLAVGGAFNNNSSGTVNASTNVTVESGGVLSNSGILTSPILTVSSGGTLANSGTAATPIFVLNGAASNIGTITSSTSATIGSGAFLSNNGVLNSATLVVAGELRGTGTINAPTSVTGTLAPGNSPGTLTFNAPVTLTSGATSEFDIDGTGTGTGAGNFGRVIVMGTASVYTAAGILEPLLRGISGSASNTYTPPIGQQFQVISAQGGVLGSFAGLIQPTGLPTGTRFDAIYAPASVTLVVTPSSYGNLPLAGLSQNANAAAVGKALDAIRPTAGVSMDSAHASLLYPLYVLTGPAVPQALGQLAPSIYGEGLMAARDTWHAMADSVSDQLAARRAGSNSAQTTAGPHGSTVWMNGLGQFTDVTGSDAPGYRTSVGGAIAGIDVPLFPSVTIGAAVGGGTVQTSSGGATDNGTAVQFSLYGGWQSGMFFLDGLGAYLHMDQDIRRSLNAWNASTRGSGGANGGGAQVRGGVRLTYGRWQVEPSVGFSAIGLSSGAMSETTGGSLAERVSSETVSSVQSLAGLRVSTQFAVTPTVPLRVYASLGWQHEYGDAVARTSAAFQLSGASPFTVSSTPVGRDAARLGVGVDVIISPSISLYGAYRAALGREATSQNLTGGLRITW